MVEFFKKAAEIVRKHEDQERKNGNGFNIFETLNLTTDEVRMSSLIAEFLNPHGSHKQGEKYLEQFLEMLYEKSPVFVKDNFTKEEILSNPHVQIEQSHKIDDKGSRIDIVIENDKCAIIIENKINAGDQDNQLWRYWKAKEKKKVMLVYLTLEGNYPDQESNTLKSTNGESSLNESQIMCLSYRFDILDWLSKCLDKSMATPPHIGVIIDHMVQNLRKITNQVDKEMEKELVELVLQKGNLEIADQISKVVSKARAEKTYEFFIAVKNHVDESAQKFRFKQFGFKATIARNEKEWNWAENKHKLLDNIVIQNDFSKRKLDGAVRLYYKDDKGNIVYLADGYNGNHGIWCGVFSESGVSYQSKQINEKLEKGDKTVRWKSIDNLKLWDDGVFQIMDENIFDEKVDKVAKSMIDIMNILHNENV